MRKNTGILPWGSIDIMPHKEFGHCLQGRCGVGCEPIIGAQVAWSDRWKFHGQKGRSVCPA